MMLTSTCDCTDATLTISLFGAIIMVQVSWSFYISDVDHSVAAPTISTLHERCIMDVPILCLVLLYQFKLGSREFLVIFHIYFMFHMY